MFLNLNFSNNGTTSIFVRGGGVVKFYFLAPLSNLFSKKRCFQDFESKKRHFLIDEVLAKCSMIYLILIISKACFCTSNNFKMIDMSKLIKHVCVAKKTFLFF